MRTRSLLEQREAIKQDLRELISEARRMGRWLVMDFRGVWLSPDELATHIQRGEYVWPARSWRLARPEERDEQLEAAIVKAKADLATFRTRYRERDALVGAAQGRGR